jgi:hypothetical protein
MSISNRRYKTEEKRKILHIHVSPRCCWKSLTLTVEIRVGFRLSHGLGANSPLVNSRCERLLHGREAGRVGRNSSSCPQLLPTSPVHPPPRATVQRLQWHGGDLAYLQPLVLQLSVSQTRPPDSNPVFVVITSLNSSIPRKEGAFRVRRIEKVQLTMG